MEGLNQELIMYITNLLVETLPEEQRTEEILKRLGLEKNKSYMVLQLLFTTEFKALLADIDEEEAVIWKKELHRCIMDGFSYEKVHAIAMLNLQPFIRTIIIQYSGSGEDAYFDTLDTAFSQLTHKVEDQYGVRMMGCFGSMVEDFYKLGISYKRARKLQEYHYIVGKGKSEFYDRMDHKESISLVEYKYVHLFEEMLNQKEWIPLFDLINTIKDSLYKNQIIDSKTMYIYKEIFSITIRYMFTQADKYREEIERLNSGIIRFEQLFDDVEDIHEFYLQVFRVISSLELYDGINPHIKKILHMIQTKYMDGINLDMVADDLNLSVAYLSRLFKSEMGVNYKHYLTRYRLDKAKELLSTTNKDIKDIRELVGYQTPTQFVRAFKSEEGMTPSKYRQISKVIG